MRSASAGEPFGRYSLLEPIGAGGMATVWRAVLDGPKGFARELAIKRIARRYARDPEFVELLAHEARLCGRLRHPNIVEVQDFGDVDGEYFLAMELIDGFDLCRVLEACTERERRLPVGIAGQLALEVASALAYAHELADESGRPVGLVHRDLSPSNVMVTRLGAVKLLDFGVAKAQDRFREERTRTGTLKGKLAYFSPEQAEGLAIDRRSDIFSLGAVLYECLTLRRPFQGASDLETLRLVRRAELPAPSTLVPELDAAIDAVVLKMMERDPQRRFQRCEEVVAALSPLVRHAGGGAQALAQLLTELRPTRAPIGAASPESSSSAPGTQQIAAPGKLAAVKLVSTPPAPQGAGKARARGALFTLAALGLVAGSALLTRASLLRGPVHTVGSEARPSTGVRSPAITAPQQGELSSPALPASPQPSAAAPQDAPKAAPKVAPQVARPRGVAPARRVARPPSATLFKDPFGD